MTYHPSTTRRAPYEQLHDDALAYLVEVFGAELWRTLRDAPPIHAADQLYELVGPDPAQLRRALDLLRLVKAAAALDKPVEFDPPATDGTSTVTVGAGRPGYLQDADEDLGAACRRLLAQLKDGGA